MQHPGAHAPRGHPRPAALRPEPQRGSVVNDSGRRASQAWVPTQSVGTRMSAWRAASWCPRSAWAPTSGRSAARAPARLGGERLGTQSVPSVGAHAERGHQTSAWRAASWCPRSAWAPTSGRSAARAPARPGGERLGTQSVPSVGAHAERGHQNVRLACSLLVPTLRVGTRVRPLCGPSPARPVVNDSGRRASQAWVPTQSVGTRMSAWRAASWCPRSAWAPASGRSAARAPAWPGGERLGTQSVPSVGAHAERGHQSN